MAYKLTGVSFSLSTGKSQSPSLFLYRSKEENVTSDWCLQEQFKSSFYDNEKIPSQHFWTDHIQEIIFQNKISLEETPEYLRSAKL